MTDGNVHDEALRLRVLRLERTLRRTRLVLHGLVAVLVLGALVAWRAQDEMRTHRLVLTNGVDSAAVVLRAVPPGSEPGVILETTSGRRILVLGGDAARWVR